MLSNFYSDCVRRRRWAEQSDTARLFQFNLSPHPLTLIILYFFRWVTTRVDSTNFMKLWQMKRSEGVIIVIIVFASNLFWFLWTLFFSCFILLKTHKTMARDSRELIFGSILLSINYFLSMIIIYSLDIYVVIVDDDVSAGCMGLSTFNRRPPVDDYGELSWDLSCLHNKRREKRRDESQWCVKFSYSFLFSLLFFGSIIEPIALDRGNGLF